MRNIYELSSELESIESFVEEYAENHDGEIPDDVFDAFDLLTEDFEQNAEGVADLIRKKEDEAQQILARAKKFGDYARRLTRTVECLKGAVKRGMEATGKKKCGPFSVCKNGGKLPVVVDGDVPEEFLIFEPKQDSDKIREALLQGAELPFARFGERGTHIRMKV